MPTKHVNLEEEVTITLTKNQTLLLITGAAHFMNGYGLTADLNEEQIAEVGSMNHAMPNLVKSNPTAKHNEQASVALHEALVKLGAWLPRIALQ